MSTAAWSGRRPFDVGSDPIPPDPASVGEQVRAEFDLPERLSDRTAERALGDAIERLAAGNAGAAAERLSAAFVTPCGTTVPEDTDHGDGHRSSCFRHGSENRSTGSAPDDR